MILYLVTSPNHCNRLQYCKFFLQKKSRCFFTDHMICVIQLPLSSYCDILTLVSTTHPSYNTHVLDSWHCNIMSLTAAYEDFWLDREVSFFDILSSSFCLLLAFFVGPAGKHRTFNLADITRKSMKVAQSTSKIVTACNRP